MCRLRRSDGSGAVAQCIFCEILAGRAEGSFVYRDAICAAFMDIHQPNAGKVLVVPNQHVASLAELLPAVGGHLFQVAQRIAAALRRSALPCEGINLFLADGRAAGQEVFHVHLHVLPRVAGDGIALRFGAGHARFPSRPELDRLAAEIHAHL
ncbi:MAG: HIT family protein [Anaerolineae bacterium]|nr:HIT family protein [Anaerolineae bacterium]